jgi:tetratricopeptide (TPR) repeat protein
MIATCLAWPCLAAPEPLRPPSIQVRCENESMGFSLTMQIDACREVAAEPDLSKEARAQAYLKLGQSYLRGMLYDRAIDAFNAAIRLSPDSGMAFGGRGKAHIARDEIYQGIADFDYALKLDHSLDLYAERGAALVKVGKPEDAASDFTNALARSPNDAGLLAQRGVEFFKAGHPEQAAADLERAIALDPNLEQHPTYGPFITEFIRPRRR